MATDLSRIAELEREVQSLKATVENLARRDASELSIRHPLPHASRETLDKVVRLTQELFPGSVSVDLLGDPESPEDVFVVLGVEATGDDERLIDRQCEWHERVAELASDANSFRLSIHPQP